MDVDVQDTLLVSVTYRQLTGKQIVHWAYRLTLCFRLFDMDVDVQDTAGVCHVSATHWKADSPLGLPTHFVFQVV